MDHKTRPALPPIQTLFANSWKTFKGSVLNLFILNLVSIGLIMGVCIVGIIISLPFGIIAIISSISSGKLDPAVIISSIGALGTLLVIIFLIFTVIGLAMNAANTLFVGKYESKPAFGKTFKGSFKYVLPLFLVGLLSNFIIVGGYFLFIIPGIFFGILFSFAPYEIVLNNQGVLSSMRRSARIVLANFWGIFSRLILWIIIVMIIAFLPGILSERSTTAGAGLSGLSFFINIFLGWYGVCYSITLYKQASNGLEANNGTKLLWPIITGIMGWIVGIIMLTALTSVIILVANNMAKKNTQPKTYQINQGQQSPRYAPWKPSTPSAR